INFIANHKALSKVISAPNKMKALEHNIMIVSRTEEVDDYLIGGNVSADVQDKVDKTAYLAYANEYMKSWPSFLHPLTAQLVSFMSGAQAEVKKIIGSLSGWETSQLLTDKGMNPEGVLGFLDYCEDGIMLFFKDGLKTERCVSLSLPVVWSCVEGKAHNEDSVDQLSLASTDRPTASGFTHRCNFKVSCSSHLS
uniref:Uncharacterized protein n=1 Tax=Denticeps clupeoides TaxID=299321 RepID=A0AAY4C8X3_9TELE